MREIIIPYQPRTWAKNLHDNTKRWKVIVAHRRCGKSTAALNHLQRSALQEPQSRYAYISPTYKQSKNIAWELIKHYAQPIPNIQFNESELTVKYPNGSRLTLYGADNPDSLRGIGLWGVVFDEYSQQPSNIFTEIIRPALADHSGYAIWIGTPKGKNEFYRLYAGIGKDSKKIENFERDWLSLLLTVDDTHIISTQELDDARSIMSEDEFQQEWYCSFEAAIKGAYYAKELRETREQGRIKNIPHDKSLPVHTWWDLGIGDATAIGFFQIVGMEWRMIDYYETSGEGLAHYAQVLQKKGYIYGEHYAPHDIEVRELGSGKSRLEMASSLGIRFKVAPNIRIEDGINAVRTRFNTLWFDTDKCAYFLDALALYQKEWDDKQGQFKAHPLHDWTSHAADMLRYWAVTNFKTENKNQYTPVLREFHR